MLVGREWDLEKTLGECLVTLLETIDEKSLETWLGTLLLNGVNSRQ